MTSTLRAALDRIDRALDAAAAVVRRLQTRPLEVTYKSGDDPVTAMDVALNGALRQSLLSADEGWLSEETADSPERLQKRRVWIVDPLDGTREFVEGVPEWCVSVGLVDGGRPVAGGILNPLRGERILGAAGLGVTLNGQPVRIGDRGGLRGATVLASRSEWKRGEWALGNVPFTLVPTGSVAYKLARVAAGLADATWTLQPKHEWDIAAGVALVLAAGGKAWIPDGSELAFNRATPKVSGLVAASPGLAKEIHEFLAHRAP